MRIVDPVAKKGEDIASNYLRKSGYSIIEKNYRKKYEELDIVAIDKKENALVFVEVKTRTSAKFGQAKESIAYWKLKRLINAAQFYKISHRNLPDLMRMDAVFVVLENGLEDIEHIKNISGF